MTARFLMTIHGADGEIISIDLKEASSPDEFAAACRELVTQHEGDEAHRKLDALVTELLTSLGFGEGMAIFLDAVASKHGPAA